MATPRETFILSLCSIGLLLACFLVVVANPRLDILITEHFYLGDGKFYASSSDSIPIVRKIFLRGFTALYILVIVAGIFAYSKKRTVLKLAWHNWAYIGLCGILGPTLLTNVILKGNWGRARPRDISDFGGGMEFTQFWVWADQCKDNCSFVSGEVSTAAMVLISLAMVSSHGRYWLLAGSVIAMLANGYLRVSAGAHFSSDSVLTLPLMMLVACGVYWICYLRKVSLFSRFEAKLN